MKILNSFLFITILFLSGCKEKEEKLDTKKLKKIANTYGQFAPEDAFEEDSEFAYYGSENAWTRRQFSEAGATRLYKRRGQRQLLEILDGNLERALELTKVRQKDDPNDAEVYFIQTIVYAQLKDIKKALVAMNAALKNGMDFSRFLAGPRDLLQPIYQTKEFKDLHKKYGSNLIQGPMLGQVTDHSASFWVRTVEEDTVEIKCFDSKEPETLVNSAKTISNKNVDYTAIITLDKLKSNTRYIYEVFVNGIKVEHLKDLNFRTYPSKNNSDKFTIGLGGGAGYTPQYEKMWNTIDSHQLDAMLLLGDNVYLDIPEMPSAFHDYTYYRRQSQPDFRNMVSSTPIYAIWDDHDAATDDVWLGPYVDKPVWKIPLLNVFKNNWNNSQYGTEEWPACWFDFSISDVDFFMLDGRTYRTNPFKKEKTMLGPTQKEWLLNSLKNSTATFKIIVSPVPWALGAKPGSHDTWAGFENERKEIFQFLTANKIEGVVLLSADRHRTDFWKNERENDYPLYEFMSSRLTNIHTHDLMPDAIFGYNEKNSFGKMTFDTTLDDPEIKFELINIDNELIHTYTLKKSELK